MTVLGQILRYAIVGVASNLLLFGLYLVATRAGLGPAIAATVVYGLGVLQTFLLNRRWTFRDEGSIAPSFGRYVCVCLLGYVVNLVGLITLVAWGGYPHELAEAMMIVVVAVLLFSLQKWWVFQGRNVASTMIASTKEWSR